MSKKWKKGIKKQVPAVFNTSQIFSQMERNSIQCEQPLKHNKPKDEGMAVNGKGDLVWKEKKIRKRHHFSIDINWGVIIWGILTIGLFILHIWIWDYVNENGHLALWFFNVVFLLCFMSCAWGGDDFDFAFNKPIDIDFYSYTEEKDEEKPFKVKMPKDLGIEPASDSLQITKDKTK